MKKKVASSPKALKLTLLGAGVAALAGTAYFFLGPKGKKHQKQAKDWAVAMKGDVIKKLKVAREVTEPVYHKIIDSVAKEYAIGAKAGKAEIHELAKDLKKHWKTFSSAAKTAKKEVVKGAKSVAKKAGL